MLFGCSSAIKIAEALKTKHISGLRNGKDYIDYTLKINAKNRFQFKELSVNGAIIKKSLYVKNLATGLSSTKISDSYAEGSYIFGFRIFDVENFKDEEILTFQYLMNSKEYSIETPIDLNRKIANNK